MSPVSNLHQKSPEISQVKSGLGDIRYAADDAPHQLTRYARAAPAALASCEACLGPATACTVLQRKCCLARHAVADAYDARCSTWHLSQNAKEDCSLVTAASVFDPCMTQLRISAAHTATKMVVPSTCSRPRGCNLLYVCMGGDPLQLRGSCIALHCRGASQPAHLAA